MKQMPWQPCLSKKDIKLYLLKKKADAYIINTCTVTSVGDKNQGRLSEGQKGAT